MLAGRWASLYYPTFLLDFSHLRVKKKKNKKKISIFINNVT